jgi:hypothetical protein
MKRKDSRVPTATYFDDMKCGAGKKNIVHFERSVSYRRTDMLLGTALSAGSVKI